MRQTPLRRGEPLKRTKPLISGGQYGQNSLRSGTPTIGRQIGFSAKPASPRRAVRDTGPDRATRELVLLRDGYACVCCGRSVIGQIASLQHRKRRSQGGTNLPSNLVTVLGDGTRGCHARMDSRCNPHDEARGFTVRTYDDPALVPVMLHGQQGGVTVWLTDSGQYSLKPPAEVA